RASTSARSPRAPDLAQDQFAEVVETERATQGVVYPLLELAHERKTLLFVVDVSHAYTLAEAINRIRPVPHVLLTATCAPTSAIGCSPASSSRPDPCARLRSSCSTTSSPR